MKKIFATTLLALTLSISMSLVMASGVSAATNNKSMTEIAAFLGMDTQTLIAQIDSGLSLYQIAENQGVTKDALRDFLSSGATDSALTALLADADFVQGLADIFGITTAQLQSYLDAGMSIADITAVTGTKTVEVKGYVKTAVEAYKANQVATPVDEPVVEIPVMEAPDMTTPAVAQYQ